MNRLLVRDLMRECTDALVDESIKLRDAAERLLTNDVAVLVATSEDGRISGVVAEAAIIRQLMATPDRDTNITAILSRHVETARPEAEVDSILHLFRSSCHAIVPVVGEDDQVVGIVHRADVVRMLLESSQHVADLPSEEGGKPHFLGERSDAGRAANGRTSDSDEQHSDD